MTVREIAAFWTVAVLLIMAPGPDWAFTISAGLRGRSVLPAVAGLVIGYAAVTVIVAAGVGALVAGSAAVLTGLTVAGGAYLLWQGALTVARPAAPTVVAAQSGSGWGVVARGIGVSGLNPKGLLMFLALLPQFTDRAGRWPIAGQIGVLGLVFVVTCGLFYLGLGSFARLVLHARPGVARAVSRVSGVAMIVIGVGLVVERLIAGWR